MSHSTDRRPRWLLAAAVPVGLVASGLLVWQASYAAFTASTTSPANTFSTGNVVLSQAPASGSTLFNVTGLAPGDTGFQCVTVTYSGTLAADIRLHGAYEVDGSSVPIDGLGPYLDFVVDRVDPAVACAATGNLVGGGNVYTGTLDGFITTAPSYATDLLAWDPAANSGGETRRYRFSYELQDVNAAQGESASASLTFEARST